MKNIVSRLKEPSTWAGFAALSSLFGAAVAPEHVAQVGGGIMALLAVFMPENKGPSK